MSEEQARILNMLAEGKINVEEAERLLDAVRRAEPGPAKVVRDGVEKLGDAIGDLISSAVGGERDEGGLPGEPVEAAAEGFDVSAEDTVVVRVTGGSLRVVQEAAGTKATVTSTGAKAPLVSRQGKTVHVRATRKTGSVEVRIPPVEAMDVTVTGGEADLDGVDGRLRLKIMGGGLNVRGCSGELRAKATGGDVDVDGDIESLDLRMMGGSADVQGLAMVEGHHRVKVMGGSVALGIRETAGITVNTEVFGGNVRCDHPAEAEEGFGPRRRLTHRFGSGEAVMNIKIMGGDVHLARMAGTPAADAGEES